MAVRASFVIRGMTGGLGASDRSAVGVGGTALVEGELALEVGEGFVTAIGCDLVHGLVGLGEEAAGAADTKFVEVTRESSTGAAFEESAERADAEAGELGEDGGVDGPIDILCDELAGAADPVIGGGC